MDNARKPNTKQYPMESNYGSRMGRRDSFYKEAATTFFLGKCDSFLLLCCWDFFFGVVTVFLLVGFQFHAFQKGKCVGTVVCKMGIIGIQLLEVTLLC